MCDCGELSASSLNAAMTITPFLEGGELISNNYRPPNNLGVVS